MRDQRAMPPPPPPQQQPPQPPPQPQHLLQPPALPDWAAGLNIDDLVSWGAPGLGREPSLPMPAAASASSAGGPADNDRAAIEAVLRQQREQIAELTRKNEEIVNQLVKQRKQQREGM